MVGGGGGECKQKVYIRGAKDLECNITSIESSESGALVCVNVSVHNVGCV